MPDYASRVQASCEFLKKWDAGNPVPDLCVVLGSGLANALPQLDHMPVAQFSEIPGFNSVGVAGHRGELRVGEVSGVRLDGTAGTRRVAFLRGRNHAYEGYSAADVAHNVRSLVAWGVKGVILTNAAGCLVENWELGRFMLISDHINQTGLNPLLGEGGEGFGPRFQDMTCCYNAIWRNVFRDVAARQNEPLYEGVYYGVLGPSYETPAEIRMMKTLGAQAVGMSTVLEAIAARQMGATVAGLSCLTNYGAGLEPNVTLEHSHVVAMGQKFAATTAKLILDALVSLPI